VCTEVWTGGLERDFHYEIWTGGFREIVCTVGFGLEVLERDCVHCEVLTGGLERDCVHCEVWIGGLE
jgi:hypothetical protein